ncbi:MAG: SOS-response transcriptional repressors (RecA-mediated autopeptidases), partial [Methylococcaceae bacterium NSM2-1]
MQRISLIFTIMHTIPPCQIVGSEDLFNPGPLGRNVFIPAVDRDAVPVDLYICKVVAGFPSPADDYVEKSLDLNELLIKRPAATFFVRVEGDSMLGDGIHPDDILVVDRSLTPDVGKIVVCALNGELTVKRLAREDQQWRLVAANPDYPDI